MKEFLSRLNDENNGLIDQAREWIAEGWGLKGDPTPEQIAAALLMEARTQDECVKAGQSSPELPRQLRQVAFTILDATLLKSDDTDSDASRKIDMAESEKFILLWVYGDEDDSPYILRNPPETLQALLTEWTELDHRYVDDQPGAADEWQPVNEWLKAKGVDIIEPADQVTL